MHDALITGLSDKRGPARVAATLYSETPESVAAQEEHRLERKLARPLGADLGLLGQEPADSR